MAFSPLEFTKSWENPEDFPTYEPNEAQVRADLQLLHNETRDWINRLVESLNDASAAEKLPFLPGDGMTAQTVQAAIREVFAATRDAAAGQLLDGTVGKEKLTRQLLDRIYGGRVWAAMDSPGAAHCPDSDFPIGQLWLRPRFAVDNLAAADWILSGGTAQKSGSDWVLTADGSQAYLSAAQSLTHIGLAGQRLFVSLTAAELDDHLSTLTLFLNGKGHNLMSGGGVFETTLDSNGSLEILVQGQWPYAEADAAFLLQDFAVVNADAVEAALPDYQPLSDWAGLIRSLVPFAHAELERLVWMQVQPGQWVQMIHETLPVSRGGTGRQTLPAGQLLFGGGGEAVCTLEGGAENGYLQCLGGLPTWRTREQVITDLAVLQMATGSYTGRKTTTTRTVALPVVPKLLFLFSPDGLSTPIPLISGAKATHTYSSFVSDNGSASYLAHVALNGSNLLFSSTLGAFDYRDAQSRYFNEDGKTYHWVALY